MKITAEVNAKESILGKKRVIDFDIIKDNIITLSQKAQFIGKIIQTKNKTEVKISGLVFDGNKSGKNTTEEILKHCEQNDKNFARYKL